MHVTLRLSALKVYNSERERGKEEKRGKERGREKKKSYIFIGANSVDLKSLQMRNTYKCALCESNYGIGRLKIYIQGEKRRIRMAGI